MVTDQGTILQKLVDRADRAERQAALDRRDDRKTMAVMFCVLQEESDLTLKTFQSEFDVRIAEDRLYKYEYSLRAEDDKIDDLEHEEQTERVQKKVGRAKAARGILAKIHQQRRVIASAHEARTAIRSYVSSWQSVLVNRLGVQINELCDDGLPLISTVKFNPATNVEVATQGPSKRAKSSEPVHPPLGDPHASNSSRFEETEEVSRPAGDGKHGGGDFDVGAKDCFIDMRLTKFPGLQPSRLINK